MMAQAVTDGNSLSPFLLSMTMTLLLIFSPAKTQPFLAGSSCDYSLVQPVYYNQVRFTSIEESMVLFCDIILKKGNRMETVYKKSIVAFIDILGFSDMVKKSGKESMILEVLKGLKSLERDPFQQTDRNLLAVSDSVILSYQVNDGDEIVALLDDLAFLLRGFVRYGLVLRGGIALGDLYHDDTGVIFGPAYLEAYGLEQIADYPRIIMKEEDYLMCCYGFKKQPRTMMDAKESKNVKKEYLVEDPDGFLRLDLFKNYDPDISDVEYLLGWKSIIEKNLELHGDKHKVKQKYLWLRSQYNNFIKKNSIDRALLIK